MRTSGFTLLELLVVMAILGILFALMANLSREPFALRGAANTLSSHVTRARTEALRRNEFVGVHIDKANSQFFLFEDIDRNQAYSTGDKIIPASTVSLPKDYPDVKFGDEVAAAGYTMVYDTRGISRTTTPFNVVLKNKAATRAKTVAVSGQGRSRVR